MVVMVDVLSLTFSAYGNPSPPSQTSAVHLYLKIMHSAAQARFALDKGDDLHEGGRGLAPTVR